MAEEKVPRDRMSPSKRGYVYIYLQRADKEELRQGAKGAGFRTIAEYVLHLHRTKGQPEN